MPKMSTHVLSRARPIRFFWAETNVFHFSLPISNIFDYLSSIYFASWGKINTPGVILPSATHFHITAERHDSAFISSGHINKENNFTSYNYYEAKHTLLFCLVRQIFTSGAILPPAEHDWLNWSHDKFGQHDCVSWLWHL